MPDPRLGEAEFKRRFLAQYSDPVFGAVGAELARVAAVAWDAYAQGRKSPVTRKAGAGFADPDYDLSVEWIAAHEAIKRAQQAHDDAHAPSRILLINAASRSEHTCPGESSKSYRLLTLALDGDEAVQQEVRNAALMLLEAIQQARAGSFAPAGTQLPLPRDK